MRTIKDRFYINLVCSSLCLCASVISPCPCIAGDWTHWRGPEQNGVSREHDLPDRWSPNPKAENNNLVWKQPYGGRSTPIIMTGRGFFMNSTGQGLTGHERFIGFDAINARAPPSGGRRPASAPKTPMPRVRSLR